MSTVTLEHDAGKLAELTDRVQVLDASGRLLGYFTPKEPGVFYQRIEVPEMTEEEIREAEEQIRAGQVHSTAEVIAYLRTLEVS